MKSYFKTLQGFNDALANGTVTDNDISFCAENGGIYTHGKWHGIGGGGVISLTYDELFQLYSEKKLTPSQMYAITDYTCAYIHPSITSPAHPAFECNEPADDVEKIILLAVSEDRFDKEVFYIRKEGYIPINTCYYDIDPETCYFTKGMTTYKPTGVVYYMEDESGNACNYDFKHVKFKRWAITNIEANLDENNGTGGTCGPFNVKTMDTCYVFSDTRSRVGSGDAFDEQYVEAIYNGTWRSLVGGNRGLGYSSLKDFHQDYITNVLKPYQRTEYPYDKYLAWQPDMYTANGCSAGVSVGTCTRNGMSRVHVDENDYVMRYTFDYDLTDASDRPTVSGTKRLIGMVRMVDRTTSLDSLHNVELPNTVIAISKSAINNNSTQIWDVEIGSNSQKNTILLSVYNPSVSFAYFNKCKLGGERFMRGNLIISRYIYNLNIKYLSYNYLNGEFLNVFGFQLTNSVMFGYFSSIQFVTSDLNLFFGSNSQIKEVDATSWKSPSDGEYWYDTEWRDWFAYNILAPFQYSTFRPHFNCNTFRCIYNKGVEFWSANQKNSYGFLAWGTRIGYGIGQGIKFGDIVRSLIDSVSFNNDLIKKNSSGVEVFNSDQTQVPNIWQTHVNGNYWKAQNIRTDLSATALARIASNGAGANGGVKYELCPDTAGKWHLYVVRGDEVGAASTASDEPQMASIEENPITIDFDDHSAHERYIRMALTPTDLDDI